MRITFVVERATQFEAPFYRFAAADREHVFEVLFSSSHPAAAVFDPELGRTVEWGIDLLGGYPHEVLPARGQGPFLRGRLRPDRCDLVITNGYTHRSYLRAAWAAKRAGVPTGLRLDSVPARRAGVEERVKRLLFEAGLTRLFDVFFAASTLTLRYLAGLNVPVERTARFPYAVDVEDFRARSHEAFAQRTAVRYRLGVPDDARVILAVCKLSEREAPWDLLRARLGHDFSRSWIVVAGEGPARHALERFVGDSGIDSVAFAGYVPYPELPALYAAADVFVHAAREERWGVSVAEALACGLPVVASSAVGAANDLVVHGRNGFVYEPGETAQLAERIRAALALPPEQVRQTSREVLARWDYGATWRGLLEAAERIKARRRE